MAHKSLEKEMREGMWAVSARDVWPRLEEAAKRCGKNLIEVLSDRYSNLKRGHGGLTIVECASFAWTLEVATDFLLGKSDINGERIVHENFKAVPSRKIETRVVPMPDTRKVSKPNSSMGTSQVPRRTVRRKRICKGSRIFSTHRDLRRFNGFDIIKKRTILTLHLLFEGKARTKKKRDLAYRLSSNNISALLDGRTKITPERLEKIQEFFGHDLWNETWRRARDEFASIMKEIKGRLEEDAETQYNSIMEDLKAKTTRQKVQSPS
ncbi:hypothetical protein HYW58_00700 [Candidatus Kaiserbacteria bacterium]|nr:hypothetical protein [Candidatus Kaiserbacteria bacterium]